MKNLILFCLLLISASLCAQLNEISVTYTPLKDEILNKSTSLNYYRNLNNSLSLGIKANFSGIGSDDYQKTYAGNIDIVTRWNFSKSQTVRFTAEIGISKLRTYDEPMYWEFCGTISPGERIVYPHFSGDDKWIQIDYYGAIARIGLDFSIKKYFIFGADYGIGAYRTNQENVYKNTFNTSDLRIKLGVKF